MKASPIDLNNLVQQTFSEQFLRLLNSVFWLDLWNGRILSFALTLVSPISDFLTQLYISVGNKWSAVSFRWHLMPGLPHFGTTSCPPSGLWSWGGEPQTGWEWQVSSPAFGLTATIPPCPAASSSPPLYAQAPLRLIFFCETTGASQMESQMISEDTSMSYASCMHSSLFLPPRGHLLQAGWRAESWITASSLLVDCHI